MKHIDCVGFSQMELFGPKSGRPKAPLLAIDTLSSCLEETQIRLKTRSGLCSCPTLQEGDQVATSLLALIKPCKATSFHSRNKQKFTGNLRVCDKYFHWRNLTQNCQHVIGFTLLQTSAAPHSAGKGEI